METTEYTAIVRSMIQHEDTLRDQRLGWLFALNGFLFTGLGFAWADDDSGPLIVVLAIVGVLVAVSSAVALTNTQRAIDKLDELATERAKDEAIVLPPVIALRSKELRETSGQTERAIDQSKRPIVTWLYPWKMLPWALAIAWLVIPVVRAVAM
jgi:hypothetical protein